MPSKKRLVHIIYGPTASGKSAYALDLAQQSNMNGVVINADAMQCYDALPILTAKPSPEEQDTVPHKLYSVIPPEDSLTAAGWRDLALKEIENCFEYEETPLLTGGTGFYIKALTEGISPIPDVLPEIRENLIREFDQTGAAAFYDRLQHKDPLMAERLKPGDRQRVIRAMGVVEGTGKSLAYWQNQPMIGVPDHYNFQLHLLLPKKDMHIQKINARFDLMMEMGVLDEVQDLSDKIDTGFVTENALIVKAHGFRPLRQYLKGEMSLEDASEQTKLETRQYAKRQRTWARTQLKHFENIINVER